MWQIYALMARDLNEERQRKLENEHRIARAPRPAAGRGLFHRLVSGRKA